MRMQIWAIDRHGHVATAHIENVTWMPIDPKSALAVKAGFNPSCVDRVVMVQDDGHTFVWIPFHEEST